jgi:hypothetical protein
MYLVVRRDGINKPRARVYENQHDALNHYMQNGYSHQHSIIWSNTPQVIDMRQLHNWLFYEERQAYLNSFTQDR